MGKSIVVDPEKCTGCRICEMICSFRDGSNPYNSKIKVKKNEERGIDLPVLCFHCSEALCAEACPNDAILRGTDGAVTIDAARCNGCQACSEACPYGAIQFVNDQASKCNLCGGDPVCVKWCPTEAIGFREVCPADIVVNRKRIQEILRQLE